jgi:hypothetical protein
MAVVIDVQTVRVVPLSLRIGVAACGGVLGAARFILETAGTSTGFSDLRSSDDRGLTMVATVF